MTELVNHYKSIVDRYDRQYQQLFGQRTQVIQHIIQYTECDKKTGLTISDIGGGTGAALEQLKDTLGSNNTYILVEPYAEMIDQAKTRSEYI